MKRIKNKERKKRRKEAIALDNLKVRDFCKNCELQIDKIQAVSDCSLSKLEEDFIKEPRTQKGNFSEQTSYSKALDTLEKEDERTLTKMQESLMKEYKTVELLYNALPDCKCKSDLKPYLDLAKLLLECVKK